MCFALFQFEEDDRREKARTGRASPGFWLQQAKANSQQLVAYLHALPGMMRFMNSSNIGTVNAVSP